MLINDILTAVCNCCIGFQVSLSGILHHFQEQAFRPVPQRVNFLVGWAGEPARKRFIDTAARYSNRHIGEDINNFMNRADTPTASMI